MRKRPTSVKLSQIYLDLENPRHEPQTTESEAIQILIQSEDVRALAKHIVEVGTTSPLDMMALVPHHKVAGRYVTAEGNRRLCALKLLADPDKAAKEIDKRYFRKLQQEIEAPITEILAVVFDSMEEARPWVELRHDAPAGVGTKKWDAKERARFNKQGKGDNPNARALEIIDYARTHKLLPESEIASLVITTLTRFLSTPDVRSALGLTSSKSLEINVPTEEFERALVKFLKDSLEVGSKVNSRANSDKRREYAEELRAEGYSPTTRGRSAHIPRSDGGEPSSSKPTTEEPGKPSTGQHPQRKRSLRDRDKDKYVVPSGFISKVDDPVFSRLLRELRGLEAEEFSFSATYLFRSLLEQAAILFLRKHHVQPIPSSLHQKFGKVADLLQQKGYSGKGMSALRKMASDVHSSYSPDTIGNFVHGGQIPTRVYVIKAWDSFQPIMLEIVSQIGKK
ncbi:MAG: hypothetical protein H2060_08940 [Azoarcus sp.]|nr:hypothetical protein [Azoarcus sp.]